MRAKPGEGAMAGLMAGLALDALMRLLPTEHPWAQMSMITFATRAVHAQSALAGAFAYPAYGLVLGALFGCLIRDRAPDLVSAVALGGVYGLAGWTVTGLVVIPLDLGVAPFSGTAILLVMPAAMPLLVGHLLYGLVLGAVFGLLTMAIQPLAGGRRHGPHATDAAGPGTPPGRGR